MFNPDHDLRWWDGDSYKGVELSDCVVAAAHEVDDATTDRQQAILEAFALYGSAYNGGVESVVPVSRRLGINIIAGAVDTLVAEVSQTETAPMFATVGGTWGDRQRARKLTEYCDAKFEEHDVQRLGRQAVKDAIIAGLGCVRPYIEGEEVLYERVHPLNLLVDDRACIDVPPRELYIRRAIDRRHLMALYPEQRTALETAPAPDDAYWYPLDSTADVVEVIEAWHLATKRGAEDGRHVIAVRGCKPLCDEPFDSTHYPLAFVRASDPLSGFWGPSLVQRAAPVQLELNKLLQRIQEAQHLVSVPRVFVERGSGVPKSHLNTDFGAVVEYSGQPPVFLTPAAMPPEVYKHVERLKDWAFELMGISQMSAQSVKPAGLNSGVAIRAYRDFQSRRFINLERSSEAMFCRLAFLTVGLERQLADEVEGYEVPYKHDGSLQLAKWRDLNLDDERMRVQVLPTSALPKSAAGRLQGLQELLQGGVIDQSMFWQLADLPDFEAARNEAVAPDELIRKQLDGILDSGTYSPPEPYLDFARATQLCSRALQRAEVEGAPEARLELLRTWLVDVHDLQQRGIQQAQKEQAAQQAEVMAEQAGMPGPAPMGPPMPGPGGPMPPGPMPPDLGPMPPAGPPMPMPPA